MTPPSTRPPRRLPPSAQIVLLVVGAAALILLLVVLPAVLKAAANKPEAPEAPPPPGTFRPTTEQWRGLGFATAEPMDFAEEVSADGKIAVDDDASVQITPPFSGRVVAVAVRAGDRVARGQTLLTAEANDLAQAKADLAAAEAALSTAHAQLTLTSAADERQHALLKIQGAAQKDVQQADSDLATAQAAVHNDEAAVGAVRNRLSILNVAPSALGRADALAAVKAPVAGVVTQRQVGPGQYLNATSNGGVTPIFTVSDLSKVWLLANVREADADRMRVGLPIHVRVGGLPGRTLDARIDYVSPTLDPATRRLPVRATLPNADGALKPEMFADFAIVAGPGEQALGVPTASVIYEGDAARVWVARPDHTLALRQVKTGRTHNGEVEILDGLKAQDRVVASGAIFIDRAAKAD
ncbi:MAG: efflux RND transporter periplasmic adaptor subunit [Caulobacteraceae bacterium]